MLNLGNLIQIHPLLVPVLVNELFAEHNDANDHGPLAAIGPLTFFQTAGLGEVVDDVVHDLFADFG